MSEPQPAAIPPGWYPDGAGSAGLRWWSGVEWTEHVSAPSGPVVRPLLPAGRPIYSVFIWLIVLLPVLSIGLLFAWQPHFEFIAGRNGIRQLVPLSIYSPGYFLLLASGWVFYGLAAVFAWRDAVWLRAQGVVRPFPWPWVFLSSAVYVVGRSVIVHRVAAPRGRAPIWVEIVVLVASFTAAIIWTVVFTAAMMSQLPSIGR